VSDIVSLARSLGLNFDKVECLTVISGVAVNLTPLHVGRVGVTIDYPVERFPDGTVYIPGSSLKGVLRTTAEGIAKASRTYVCEIFGTDMTKCESAVRIFKYIYDAVRRGLSEGNIVNLVRDKAEQEIESIQNKKVSRNVIAFLEDIKSSDSLESLIEKIKSHNVPCPVCKLFGNREIASHVEVLDVLPVDRSKVKIGYRTRNAIDRFRGAARSGALFTFEYVSPGVEWNIEIRLVNVSLQSSSSESKLMKSVLSLMAVHGISVGRMRSVGLGLLRLSKAEVVEYSVEDFSLVEKYRKDLMEVV